ncbi:40S ribosomal protein S5-1 [Hordeum vulgare]|nr:40S ribosomal protein S5-1 [Hordeum vulgare]
MASPTSSMDKFFEKVISPDLSEVMKHPRTIEMRDGVPHIQDVQVSKKMGTVEARLNTTEKEVFRTLETRVSSYNGEPLPWKPEDKFDATSSSKPPPPSLSPNKDT